MNEMQTPVKTLIDDAVPPPRNAIFSRTAKLGSVAATAKAPKPNVPASEPTTWGEPIQFGTVAATPEIPPDSLLPGVFGQFAHALSENVQTPGAMAVAYCLAVLSTALQGKFTVGPWPDDGYCEPVHVWTLTIAESGERKSQVVGRLARPLTFWERRQQERERAALAENESLRRICARRVEKLENEAGKEEDADRRAAIAKEAAEIRANAPPEKYPTQLWTGDITPEELQDRLVKCGGKMAVLSDEGGLFSVLAGIYSGGESILDVFLQAHSGRDVRVNRRSRSAIIESPALTLGLSVQPGLLADMPTNAKRKFRASGLFARFLPVLPVSRVGRRDVRRRVEIPKDLQADYDRAVMALLDLENEDGQKLRLTLDDAAREVWLEFAEEIEADQGSGGNLESIRDWSAKAPGQALRLAGLLFLAEHGQAGDCLIDERAMIRAVLLCRAFIDHAMATFGLIGADPAVDDAKAVWAWIEENRLMAFTRSECHKKFHQRFSKVEHLIAALEILKGRALIRGPFTIKPNSGGRPGHGYDVNPAALVSSP